MCIQDYRYLSDFFDRVKNISEIQYNHFDGYFKGMDEDDRVSLNRCIEYMITVQKYSIQEIADSYIEWCMFFVGERKYYVTHNNEYRYHSYEEIGNLYNDESHMKNYMIGISIATYLWGIQRQNLHFFKEYCKRDMHVGGKYLEIGPGHGEYLRIAAENTNFDIYKAVDISPSSTEQTKNVLDFYYRDRRDIRQKITVECQDFFELEDSNKYDAIVCSQVIEHVENPQDFLVKMNSLKGENALVYVSTAINSPFPDHIYHFHNSSEVEKMVTESGFEIVDEFQSSADGISLEKAVDKGYDIVIGFILK